MGHMRLFYKNTSQVLLLSFAFFLVSDLAWIGYCEVTEGSLSVFFCNHEDDTDHQHSNEMTSKEHGGQMDTHQNGMSDHTHLDGLSCKTICYLKASKPDGDTDATNPLKRGLAHAQDLLTVLTPQNVAVYNLSFITTIAESSSLKGQYILDIDPYPPSIL
jgi:hypothetical protein